MATWIYEARTGEGRVVRGTRDADDRRSALEALRAEGLFPTRIETRGGTQNGAATLSAPAAHSAPAAPQPLRPASRRNASVPEPLRPSEGAANAGFAVKSNGAPPPAKSNGAPPPPPANSNGAPPTINAAPLKQPPANNAAPSFGTTTAARAAGIAASTPLDRQPFLRSSSQDLSNYFRQMAALMHAGTGLIAALHSMSQYAPSRGLREASRQMGTRIRTGEQLSDSMRAFPGLFTPLMVGILAAGERGGFMERSFTRLADYAERDYHLQQAITRETWYPKLVVFCAIVIPGVVPLFLQGWGAFFHQVGPPLVLIGLIIAAVKAFQFFRPAITTMAADPLQFGGISLFQTYDEIKLKIPVVGKVARALASAKFCRALGALYSAGVGPREAIKLGAEACGNRAIGARAAAQIPNISAGEPLTKCMEAARIFNPLALQMMRVGEESGDLDTQLDKAADFLETNAETAIKQAVPILGILAFLAVAAYVGSIVVGMYGSYANELNGIMDQK